MGSAADDRSGSNAFITHDIANEIKIHGITGDRNLSPFGLEELQLACDIDYEIHLSGTITPEEQTVHSP